jgi:hypothetical protein
VGVLLVTDVMHLRTGSTAARTSASRCTSAGCSLPSCWPPAALHPDVRQGVSADPVRREALSRVRLALLAAVVLIPPALMSLQVARADYDDLAVLAAGLGVLLALVIVRVGLLMSDVAATAIRERTLRTARRGVRRGRRPAAHPRRRPARPRPARRR